MVRRKGELTKREIDRDFPHQVAVRGDLCTGSQYRYAHAFCLNLSLAPRGHSVRRNGYWYNVFCFADPAHAEAFRVKFGGETFDPAKRGRGRHWMMWRE